jgi:hypothetical protein
MSKTIAASVIALTMGIGGLSAAGQLGGVADATKHVGQATHETAKTVGDSTKKAVSTTGKETKKATTATKNTVTGQAHARCVDGTRHSGKTQKSANAACAKHGGVAKS